MEYQVFFTNENVENDTFVIITKGVKPVEAIVKNDESDWLLVRVYFNGEYHHQEWINKSFEEYTKGSHLIRKY